MKRTLLYLLVMLLCPVMMMAQKVTVSGLIMDGTNNEALLGATVVLLQPKDSTQASGALSDADGKFKLPAVKPGSYIMRISYVGYITQFKNLTLGKSNKTVNVGTLTLQENSKVLNEAEVVARLAQVEMKADTFIYNADAFRLPEGSALEELVRKLPGAEVDDEGNIKINGKSVSKIMMDGKEFFQNDTKMAMKNLPSKMIKKLKAYERKSDYSRITGIDDGEEETVLDLTVQKGMKEGWVSNVDLSYGTPTGTSTIQGMNTSAASIPADLYSLKLNINRFLDHSQFTLIASRNNLNDAGFPGGGRGWGGWGGGFNFMEPWKTPANYTQKGREWEEVSLPVQWWVLTSLGKMASPIIRPVLLNWAVMCVTRSETASQILSRIMRHSSPARRVPSLIIRITARTTTII